MAEIDFADGFDVPEPLAWGLTPAQLGVVVTGAVLAYLALRSPLPRLAAVPMAVAAAMAGLTAALARYEGRTLISWAPAAARFWTRPRRGLLTIVDGSGRPCRSDARTALLAGVTGSGTAPRETRRVRGPPRRPLRSERASSGRGSRWCSCPSRRSGPGAARQPRGRGREGTGASRPLPAWIPGRPWPGVRQVPPPSTSPIPD